MLFAEIIDLNRFSVYIVIIESPNFKCLYTSRRIKV